jgi:putative transcriptional regulator
MSKKALDKIATGLKEALEVARGNAKPGKLHAPPRKRRRPARKAA